MWNPGFFESGHIDAINDLGRDACAIAYLMLFVSLLKLKKSVQMMRNLQTFLTTVFIGCIKFQIIEFYFITYDFFCSRYNPLSFSLCAISWWLQIIITYNLAMFLKLYQHSLILENWQKCNYALDNVLAAFALITWLYTCKIQLHQKTQSLLNAVQ